MTSIHEAIDRIERHRFLLGRLVRILTRIRPFLTKNNVTTKVSAYSEIGLAFQCPDEEIAVAVGRLLLIDVKLEWVGASTVKRFDHQEADGLSFEFFVTGVLRPVTIDECKLVRSKYLSWHKAKLIFCNTEISEFKFFGPLKAKEVKQQMWEKLVKHQDKNPHRRYHFVNPVLTVDENNAADNNHSREEQ